LFCPRTGLFAVAVDPEIFGKARPEFTERVFSCKSWDDDYALDY